MMATRTGDLNPGVIFHLLQEGMTPAQVEHLVNRDGGFFAVSGESADMKVLLARGETDARARMAIEMYCYQVKKQIGAFAAALGGLDTLVFTGGIGEHAAPIRQAVCAGLEHLGVEVDPARNAQSESVFSRDGSRVTARVVPTNEQLDDRAPNAPRVVALADYQHRGSRMVHYFGRRCPEHVIEPGISVRTDDDEIDAGTRGDRADAFGSTPQLDMDVARHTRRELAL